MQNGPADHIADATWTISIVICVIIVKSLTFLETTLQRIYTLVVFYGLIPTREVIMSAKIRGIAFDYTCVFPTFSLSLLRFK